MKRDRGIALLIFGSLFSVYVAVSRARVKAYDSSIMLGLATRILTDHTLTIDPATDTLHLQSPHVSYGFGTTLLVLPFDAVQRAIHAHDAWVVTLANPIVLSLCGVALYFIGRRLGWQRWVCTATALGFGSLTTALWQSTELFSEPAVALGALMIVLGSLVWRDAPGKASVLTGGGIAIATLCRADSILLIAPLALVVFFVVPGRSVLTRRTVLGLSAPLVAVGIFQLWYDQYRYGSLWKLGFGQQARGRGFDTPVLEGLDLLLRSPGRGFFWTSPILLLALPGIFTLYRRTRPLSVAIVVVVAVRFLYFARWWTPGGGTAWGPRLLFPVTALLAIPAGDCIQRVSEWRVDHQRRLAWISIGALAVVSAFVAFLSIAIGFEQYVAEWTNVPKALRAGRKHSYYWSLAHNPIAGNIHLLRTGHVLAPLHFRNGADASGILALVAAVGAAVAAFINGRDIRSDDPGQRETTSATIDMTVLSDRVAETVSPSSRPSS